MNKYGMNLIELAQEIMRRAEAKRDFVAETPDLVFKGRNQSSAPPAHATRRRGADWGLMGMLA
jgi:hypothetical protein